MEGLRRQRTNVLGAEENGKWLTENCPQDRTMRPGVREELSKMNTALDDLENKLQDRLNKLNNAVLQGQELDESLKDVTDKLDSIDFQRQRQKPVSPVWPDTVKQQQEQNELVKEVDKQKKLYDRLLTASDKILDTLDEGEEKEQTVDNINAMKTRWDNLNEEVAKRSDLIDQVEPLAKDHHEKKQPFEDWLTPAEETMKDLSESLPTTVEEFNKYNKAVKKFLEDVEEHSTDHKSLNETFNALGDKVAERPEECEKTTKLKEECDKVNKRWDKLNALTEKCKSKVEKLREPLKRFTDDLNKSNKGLDEILRALEDEPNFGVDTQQGEDETKRLDELTAALEAVKEDVIKCCDEDAKELEAVIDEFDGDEEKVKEKETDLRQRLADTEEKLKKRKDSLTKKNKVADQFQSTFGDLEAAYLKLSKDLADIGPVKQSPDDVKAQLEDLKNLEEEFSRVRPSLGALQDAADWLVDNNADDKVTEGDIKARYSSIANPINQLADKINDKQNRLQQALLKNLEFEDIFSNCIDQLEELSIKMDRFEPLSVKHTNLRKQDDEFKAYQVDFDQLQPIYEKVTKAVKDVKESIEDPEEKEKLTKKVKDVISKRVDLGKRVQNRRDFIDKLSPLAADEDKAQDDFLPVLSTLEEQCEKTKEVPKTLDECKKQKKLVGEVLKDIEEATPKQQRLNETFGKEMEEAKTLPKVADEPVLRKEVKDLNKRWDELNAKQHEKETQVRELDEKFTNYKDALKPVEEELADFEKVLDQQQPFRLDDDLGKKNLEDLEKLVEKVKVDEDQLKDAREKGKELAEELSKLGADPKPITDEIAAIEERLKDTKDKLDAQKDAVAKQLGDLASLNDTEKDLETSLDDMTEKTDNLEPISMEPEKIKEQLAEVQKLLDEIDEDKPKVEKLKVSGKTVCDNNPGDFSVATETSLKAKKIEEPLERIERKLQERKHKLENLLVGTQELQDTIDDFSDKLMAVEKGLEKLKPVSARYPIAKKQEATTEALLDQVDQLEPSLKTLEDAAAKVLRDAEPKEAEQVKEKIDELKDRLAKSRDVVKAKRDRIEKVLPLARSFEEIAEPLQEFITEAEQQLAPVTDDLPADKQVLEPQIDKLKVNFSLKKLFYKLH